MHTNENLTKKLEFSLKLACNKILEQFFFFLLYLAKFKSDLKLVITV